jgi:hypothetical protein
MSAIQSKLLNEIFEEIYVLMENILQNSDYYDFIAFEVENFTNNIRTEDPDELDEDADFESYFEAGYHGSTIVFYPFNHAEDLPSKTFVLEETEDWSSLLLIISHEIPEKKYKKEALDINTKLTNLINTL